MYSRFFTIVLLFAILCINSGAFGAQSTDDVTASGQLKESVRNRILGARAEKIASQDEYIIGQGDVLSVSIFEEGDMSAASISIFRGTATDRDRDALDALRTAEGVQVMMDGRISLKHIGDVEVVGLTLTELANLLKELYTIIYEDPIVTTTLVQSNSLRYTVMGNVQQPGIYYLDYPITVVQTIARSGGFTEWTDKTITIVREKVEGTNQTLFKGNSLKFDYDHFVSGKNLENNIFIKSGDVIHVN